MSADLRRRLLEDFSQEDTNKAIAWLCAHGLLGVFVTPEGLQVKVTEKGRTALVGAAVFQPSQAPA